MLPGSTDQEGWHRLHAITPFLRSWKVITVVVVIGAQQSIDQLGELFRTIGRPSGTVLLIMVAIAVALVALVGGWATLSWRMTRYRVRNGLIEHEIGVLFRQQRQAPLDRLQAVDVVQPLLGRVFGLSELRLEVAGGAGSDIKLQYLRDDDADRLRNVLLAEAAGVEYEGDQAPAAPEHALANVSPGRLIGSLLLGWDTIASVIALVAVGIATFFAPGAIFTSIPIVLGIVSAFWARLSRGFNFSAAISPDGLRLRHGLLETRTQTVPPGRVQAVQLAQPLLWRRQGWWQLKVNVAGYGPSQDGQESSSSMLMPAATREEAFVLVAQVLPDLGHPDPLWLLTEGLDGLRPAGDLPDGSAPAARRDYVTAPARARWLDPISWRRIGFAVTETALVLRSGQLTRRLVLVPHARTQSLGLTQGPLQRRMGLAGVVAHSTPGPISPQVNHLTAEVAGALLLEQAGRARQARLHSAPERWMRAAAPTAVTDQQPTPVDLVKRPGPSQPSHSRDSTTVERVLETPS